MTLRHVPRTCATPIPVALTADGPATCPHSMLRPPRLKSGRRATQTPLVVEAARAGSVGCLAKWRIHATAL